MYVDTIFTPVAVIVSNLVKFVFIKVHTVRLMNLKHWNHSQYTQLELFTGSPLSHAQKKKTTTKHHQDAKHIFLVMSPTVNSLN